MFRFFSTSFLQFAVQVFFSERLICVYSCHVWVCRVCQPKQACVTELSPLCEQFFFSINQHWNGMGSFSAVWVFCVNFILLSWNPVFLCTLMYSSCLFLLLPDQWQAVMPTCCLHHLLIFLFLLAHLLFCHIFPFCVFFSTFAVSFQSIFRTLISPSFLLYHQFRFSFFHFVLLWVFCLHMDSQKRNII